MLRLASESKWAWASFRAWDPTIEAWRTTWLNPAGDHYGQHSDAAVLLMALLLFGGKEQILAQAAIQGVVARIEYGCPS